MENVVIGFFVLYFSTSILTKEVIKLGYITGSERKDLSAISFYRRPGHFISGAITYAVKEVNDDPTILPNHTLEFIIAETYGDELYSIMRTVELLNDNISVYIGPQETCMHEGRIAASFNLPMISYFCSSTVVSDKSQYPTFARTKPTASQISKSVVSILKTFNWNKITFVHSSENEFENTAKTIIGLLPEHNIQMTHLKEYRGPYFHLHTENPFVKIVSETYIDTRIYVVLGQTYDFLGLMDHLQDRGLLDSGDYFVVGVLLENYDPSRSQKILRGLFGDNVTESTVNAFKHFIAVTQSPPVYADFQEFQKIVNYYLSEPPFEFPHPYHNMSQKIIWPEAAYLYDAVWLYARVVQELIDEGGNLTNGTAIIEKLKDRTYKSAMGYSTMINSKGDATGNFSLIAMKNKIVDNNLFWHFSPIGVFQLNMENMTQLPTFQYYAGESIEWPNNKMPVDEPPCGYRNEKCISPETYTSEILFGVAGGILLILVIIGVLVYRNWRYEQDLASLLWKIEYKDISVQNEFGGGTMGHMHNSNINRRSNIVRANSQMSLSSQNEIDFRQLFTKVGTYRGTIVAIRNVNKKHVELTRNIRKELKVMRELRHDNINPFIGACIDSPHILIVSAYCPRGSLQDILENDDLQLDTMFIASLVFDIIRGMIYLHESEIRSHGKLKSSNCVVDSRWVVKITDFGLKEFISGAENALEDYAYYRNLLWSAPECLRNKGNIADYTQEGDVFSFAIILYEIHGRRGPYGDTSLSPKDIVLRVTSVQRDPPFRPRLAELDTTPKFVCDVIKECWDEDPFRRPDFKSIRTKLKPMQKGMKPNIFDNMIAIMEKYASNLETVVEERTDQLIEEKKKTEELLHQMLPRSVAEQLKRGKEVEAESFDSVTIYFSDICGFTAMSSESTPMQVVNLLNDLYTHFDSILEHYDVYKVETIGDAYMVVSGLPKTNGINHAGEIASMSLYLLDAINKFKIRHRPEETLKLRIGIHSGSCVAGVVGLKMPRYCLFGDTVNTASRMESNGEPLKIHCSQPTKFLLDELGGYHLEERGLIPMKGKGQVLTYWLVGEDKFHRIKRLSETKRPDKSPTLSGNNNRIPNIVCNCEVESDPLIGKRNHNCRSSCNAPNGSVPSSYKQENKRQVNPFESAKINLQSPKLWKQLHFSDSDHEEESSRRFGQLGRASVSVEMSPLISSTQSADNTTTAFHYC